MGVKMTFSIEQALAEFFDNSGGGGVGYGGTYVVSGPITDGGSGGSGGGGGGTTDGGVVDGGFETVTDDNGLTYLVDSNGNVVAGVAYLENGTAIYFRYDGQEANNPDYDFYSDPIWVNLPENYDVLELEEQRLDQYMPAEFRVFWGDGTHFWHWIDPYTGALSPTRVRLPSPEDPTDGQDETIEPEGGDTVEKGAFVITSGNTSLVITTTLGTFGNDMLSGGGILSGAEGNDGLTGSAGADFLDGGAGNDWLDGGPSGDILDGGAGWDVLSYQSAASGVIVNLTTNANGGAAAGDVISNIEVLQGSNFADSLTGIDNGNGNGVQLYGEGGDDTLTGKGGGDYLFGGSGADTLDSGFGCDVLNGGAGADVFRFSTALGAGNVDTVQDFSVAEGDRIVLSWDMFAAAGYQYLSGAAFTLGPAATTTAQRIVYNQSTGELFYDVDGSGAAAQVTFAVIASHQQLSAQSFYIW
jgi:Ca2+-binding RTX toxin-like protein